MVYKIEQSNYYDCSLVYLLDDPEDLDPPPLDEEPEDPPLDMDEPPLDMDDPPLDIDDPDDLVGGGV